MPEEKVYIGTKIIKAFPLNRKGFEAKSNKPISKDDFDKEDEAGYLVTYEDGYESWSPKVTFEHAYREVSFSEKRFFV